MSAVSDFVEPVRWLLGDHDDTERLWENSVIERGIRTVIKSGLAPGYKLSANLLSITPDVPDGNDYLLVAARVALGFVASIPSRHSMRTRAWSESTGDRAELVQQLEVLINKAEKGGGCAGMQSYASFILGVSGLGVERANWGWMARLKLDLPVTTVTVGSTVTVEE